MMLLRPCINSDSHGDRNYFQPEGVQGTGTTGIYFVPKIVMPTVAALPGTVP